MDLSEPAKITVLSLARQSPKSPMALYTREFPVLLVIGVFGSSIACLTRRDWSTSRCFIGCPAIEKESCYQPGHADFYFTLFSLT
jgi:hypothetical protein